MSEESNGGWVGTKEFGARETNQGEDECKMTGTKIILLQERPIQKLRVAGWQE